MSNEIIDQVLKRANNAKNESDFTYFFSLLLAAEAIAKVAVLGIVASINEDRDRHRYRLEHALVRADGLGDWAQVGERHEVEEGIESLVQYSLAETIVDGEGKETFIALPLVASVFGKKKLNVSPLKAAIQSDIELLRMLGPTKASDASLGLSRLVSTFLANMSRRLDQGQSYSEYRDILEMICRNYPPGWLLLAQWHIEVGSPESLDLAKEALGRYLEEDATSVMAGEAWRLRANLCYRTGDVLGEITSFIERAQIDATPFYDMSGTANRLNALLRDRTLSVDSDEKKKMVERLLRVMDRRRGEADADDFSRMAWLSMHIGDDERARSFVRMGLAKDPDNYHCQNLGDRLGI